MFTAHDITKLAHTLAYADPSTLVRRVYGRHHHPDYLTGKAVEFAKDPVFWMLTLDHEHLAKLAEVFNRYANGYYIENEEEDDNNG